MTVNDVIKLLPHLKAHGVAQVKCKDLEIMFHAEQKTLEQTAKELRKQEESLPPDVRMDVSLDPEKVLNWSTQPGFDEQESPGLGDVTL